MNQLAFALGALGGVVCASLALALAWRLRPQGRRRRARDATQQDAFEQWPTSALVVDVTTHQIVSGNPAMMRSVGYTFAELCTLQLSDVLTCDGVDAKGLLEQLQAATLRTPVEMHQHCKDGSVRNVEGTCHRMTLGTREVVALAVHDVTVRRRAENQAPRKAAAARSPRAPRSSHRACRTASTWRRRSLPGLIEEAKASGNMLAVLFLDLDRFKHVNDSRGHDTGDKLLKTVAQRVRSTVRAEDLVVRMGGDEFVVILRGVTGTENVTDTSSRISEALSAPMVVDGRTLVTTVSIGVSLYPRDGTDMGELLRHSDTAMYQAKDKGRNNFQMFSPAMDKRLKERIAIESSLRTALQSRQLEVHYQPIVEIESQRVTALEALLRWKHPEPWLRAPGALRDHRRGSRPHRAHRRVRAAAHARRHGALAASRWRTGAGRHQCVGGAAATLEPRGIGSPVSPSSTDLSPRCCRSSSPRAPCSNGARRAPVRRARTRSAKLRELGVHIAIDDFGTGYSSLSYLKRWRVDTLKIDRSFVRDLVTDMSDLAIVSAIIAMARHLHIEVVAEGIEGWPQLEKVRQLGCTYAQGYLFARPAPAEDCLTYLSGKPLDLTQRLPVLDLESTGSGERVRALRA